MSVISTSHFSLVRARHSLEKAFNSNDWPGVRKWDQVLGDCLNSAFDDDNRDTSELVSELERVLHLYANIVCTLPEQAGDISLTGIGHLSHPE